MAIEIVDFPIKNSDFPISFLYVYQRVLGWLLLVIMDHSRKIPY